MTSKGITKSRRKGKVPRMEVLTGFMLYKSLDPVPFWSLSFVYYDHRSRTTPRFLSSRSLSLYRCNQIGHWETVINNFVNLSRCRVYATLYFDKLPIMWLNDGIISFAFGKINLERWCVVFSHLYKTRNVFLLAIINKKTIFVVGWKISLPGIFSRDQFMKTLLTLPVAILIF